METRNGESTVMYLIQFGNYRVYDNAKKMLSAVRQNGINAVMSYNGIFFYVVSKSFEDSCTALFVCDVMSKKKQKICIFIR